MKPWFDFYNGRLDKEYRALDALGVFYTIDEEAMAQQVLRLQLRIEGDNAHFDLPDKKSIDLVAVYPDAFPFFRPDVYAFDIQLERHHNPVHKHLCLLPRSTSFWYPSSTLADLIKEQLSKVIIKGSITDEKIIQADETEQAEPVSEYYPVNENCPVIFDTSPFNVEFDEMQGIQLLGKIRVGMPQDATFPTRLAVLETKNPEGNELNRLPSSIESLFPKKLNGVLYQLQERPPYADPSKDFEWFLNKLKGEGKKIFFPGTTVNLGNGHQLKNIIGLCFPEETGPGIKGMGWLFLVVSDYRQKKVGLKGKPIFSSHQAFYYAKAARVNRDAMTLRVPKLRTLRDEIVAVFGLGSVGAPAAIELAKAGIKELRLWDYDIVDTATAVRWPFGLAVVGMYKTQVIMDFINRNYPNTNVVVENRRLGGNRIFGKGLPESVLQAEHEVLEKFLDGVSLIYDACAELGIMHFLSYTANRLNIPYVCTYATEGAAGGSVMRVIPSQTGCWMCMRLAQDKKAIPEPPSDPSGKLQIPGCGDISFTGAGFDLQNISLAGVRMAVSTLCREFEGAYPNLDWDIGILSLVDEEQKPIFPKWSVHKLIKYPECPYCAGSDD